MKSKEKETNDSSYMPLVCSTFDVRVAYAYLKVNGYSDHIGSYFINSTWSTQLQYTGNPPLDYENVTFNFYLDNYVDSVYMNTSGYIGFN